MVDKLSAIPRSKVSAPFGRLSVFLAIDQQRRRGELTEVSAKCEWVNLKA
jgi:hypothetical protein